MNQRPYSGRQLKQSPICSTSYLKPQSGGRSRLLLFGMSERTHTHGGCHGDHFDKSINGPAAANGFRGSGVVAAVAAATETEFHVQKPSPSGGTAERLIIIHILLSRLGRFDSPADWRLACLARRSSFHFNHDLSIMNRPREECVIRALRCQVLR